jgi:hypothetical protein
MISTLVNYKVANFIEQYNFDTSSEFMWKRIFIEEGLLSRVCKLIYTGDCNIPGFRVTKNTSFLKFFLQLCEACSS